MKPKKRPDPALSHQADAALTLLTSASGTSRNEWILLLLEAAAVSYADWLVETGALHRGELPCPNFDMAPDAENRVNRWREELAQIDVVLDAVSKAEGMA